MTAELGIAVVLAATGFAVLSPLHRHLRPAPRVWLSLPVGTALYLLTALVLVLTRGTLDPGLALVATGSVGAGGAVLTGLNKGWGRLAIGLAGFTLGLAVATVLIARTFHLTRLTPDSLQYLLFAGELRLPDALSEIRGADLLDRQMGLPSLHALSALTDRRYLASLGPLFGVYGFGFFVWFLWDVTRGLAPSRRWILVGTAGLFLGASNRLVYNAFYINTHVEVAVFLFVAVTCFWITVTTGESDWAFPGGLALGATLLLRPEAPVVAAIVLVAAGVSRAAWPAKLVMTAPTVAVAVFWHGTILWSHAPGGDTVSLTAPVFGSLLAVAGAVLVVLLSRLQRASFLIRHSDRLMLAGLVAVLLVMSSLNLDILLRSLEATARNLAYNGLWLLTWPVALVVTLVAFLVQRVPHGRLWTTPIAGFGLLFLLLPLIRDSAWRVGPGDSGNRILSHILMVLVAFLVLAGVDHVRRAGTS